MIVGRGAGFGIRTIQLGAASSMASISGVYSDTSIFVASAPVLLLLLLPSSSPPSPSSSPSSSSSAAAAATPLSTVTGQEASGSGSSD